MANTEEILRQLIETVASRVIDHTSELTELDRTIGDGDHGLNMKRGFEEVLSNLDGITAQPLPAALKTVGMSLVMKVGGASGPLYGTLFMTLGKELAAEGIDDAAFASALGAAIEAVKRRGKSKAGQKTMLDVLVPVHAALAQGGDADLDAIRRAAAEAAEATIPMLAIKGRASFLGERSIGHMDPGARSSALMIDAVCEVMETLR